MKKLLLIPMLALLLCLLFSCGGSEESYTVTFTVNGEAIAVLVCEKGETPTAPYVYGYETDAKSAVFSGWDKELAPVTEDTVYAAVFSETVRSYNVTFLYGGATSALPTSVPYGVMPTAPSEGLNYQTPDAVYTFVSWNTELKPVTGDVVYTAQYTSVPREYTVTFVYGESETSAKLPYGSIPSIPTELDYASVDKLYTFRGWDKTVTSVNSDATYTAVYGDTPRSYRVTFVYGVDESQSATLPYGATPTPPTELDYLTDSTVYRFTGWDKTVAAVGGDVTYTAVYEATPRLYDVTFVYDGKSETVKVAYGTVPTLPTPNESYVSNDSTYLFTGWDKTAVAVTGDVTYTASYERSSRSIFSESFNGVDLDVTPSSSAAVKLGMLELSAGTPYVGVSFKTAVDPENPANKYLELITLSTATGSVNANLKPSEGLTLMGDATTLSVKLDLAKKSGYGVIDGYFRFRATGTSDVIKFLEIKTEGAKLLFFGTEIGTLTEAFQSLEMTFDFESGTATASLDGTKKAEATMTVPSASKAASLLDWIKTTEGKYLIQNVYLKGTGDRALLIDNYEISAK